MEIEKNRKLKIVHDGWVGFITKIQGTTLGGNDSETKFIGTVASVQST